MGLLETLVLGSYIYTTGFGMFLLRKLEKFSSNHLYHMEQRIKVLESRLDELSKQTL